MSDANIYLGDYVVDDYGRRGRVYQVHPYGCPQDEQWLAAQNHDDQPYVDGRWISILVADGGAVVRPAAVCKVVQPFEMDGRGYFRETA